MTLNRQPDQESNAEFVIYKGPDMQDNPWLQDAELEIEFRTQTGTNVNLNLFTTDAFVDIIDRDNLERTEATILTKLADNKASFDRRLADVETPPRTLLGTWEMSTAGVSSSSRALASSIAREQESFISFRLRTKGDIIQKRANESVYTAAGTNLIEINDIEHAHSRAVIWGHEPDALARPRRSSSTSTFCASPTLMTS